MTGQLHRVVSPRDAVPNRARGGDIRVLLGPATVDATSGFLGVLLLERDEQVNEHYHPYSEEFLYVVRGEVAVDLDGVPYTVAADQALFIPIGVRHRVRNTTRGTVRVVFHLSPLAPRPELGHVDTEAVP
ncbi:putative monooxygenase [Saccharothrix carnea]|uniref:Putative monooxygenase n=1 Tax=Saccharothrix carnea TaxID=1280637 RepID=A0A2P8HZ24_SACCR|nr:cupin domain-containing protein [Saccharothrix carnea]PSL51479.1 putative monooxygenase [Saccharothrix carnea]